MTSKAGDCAGWVVALMTRRDNKESLISARLEVTQCDGRGGLFYRRASRSRSTVPTEALSNRTSTTGAPLPLLKQAGSGSATVREGNHGTPT